ncbi:MAG: hypothetical protein WCA46_04620 [Actinocatenispora sp.]
MAVDWSTLTAQLILALGQLRGEQPVLVLSDHREDACYVQYLGDIEGGIWAETAGNAVLPPHRQLSIEDERVLTASGWSHPRNSWWHGPYRNHNWSFSMVPRFPDYAGLAERSVIALRDALHVASPTDLRYDAFDALLDARLDFPDLTVPRATKP